MDDKSKTGSPDNKFITGRVFDFRFGTEITIYMSFPQYIQEVHN